MKKIPIAITLFRFLLIVPMVVCLEYELWWPAAICFGLAWFSDFLDGFLARKWNVVSELGAFLDPLADKAIFDFALVWGVSMGFIPYPFVGIILLRDLIVDGARCMASRKGIVISADWFGKYKTGIFNTGTIILFLSNGQGEMYCLALTALVLGISLSIISAFRYVREAFSS